MMSTSSTRQMGHSLALLLIILLGFGLRAYALERQSLWSDEGLSLYRARLPLVDVLANTIVIDDVATRDTNPPFYFLLLNLWRRGVGETVPALRLVSVLAGVLATPLMYGVGTAVHSRRVGMLAALLTAVSPFHVWESQMVRNYSLLITLNLLAVYGLTRYVLAADKKRPYRWLLVWAIASVLGIYTHYFGAFVFAYTLLFLAIVSGRRPSFAQLWRQKRVWLLVGLLLTVMIPAVWLAVSQFRAGRQVDFYPLPLLAVMQHAVSAWGVGVEPTLYQPWYRYVPALLLAVIGLGVGWRRSRVATALVAGYQVIPIGLLLLLSLVNPIYNGARHLLLGLPPFLLLAAMGINAGFQWGKRPFSTPLRRTTASLTLLLALATLGVQSWWLAVQFTSPRLLLDDIRGAAQFLNATATADDMILLHDTIIGFVFDYYYEGNAPWQAVPTMGQQDVATATATLDAAGQNGRRTWFLVESTPRTGFPRQALWNWADENWLSFYSREFPRMWLNVRLNGYVAQPHMADLPANATPLAVTFGEELQLHGLEMSAVRQGGEPWLTTLYFSRLNARAGQYTVGLRLVDDAGVVWQQSDEALWFEYPPADWPAETLIAYPRLMIVPIGLPPGTYQVVLHLLDGTGHALATTDGRSEVVVGRVQIESPGTALTLITDSTLQSARMGPLRLLAHRLPDGPVRPGHLLPIDLFWQVRQTPATAVQLRLEVLEPGGTVITEQILPLTRADYPPTAWQPGEILQSKLNLLMPGTAVPEPHTIRLTLVDENGTLSRAITLSRPLTVAAWPLVTELPPIPQPSGATFGDPPEIRLAGVDLPETAVRPGATLPLTLIWQAITTPQGNYAVFVHLVDGAGNIVAQRDSVPVNGSRLTVSWRPDEVIVDRQELTIGPDVPPGEYTLWVGLYEPDLQVRPLLTLNGQPLPDGRLSLGQITVEAAQ